MKKSNPMKIDVLGDYTSMLSEKDVFQIRLKDFIRTEIRHQATWPHHTHILYEILLIESGEYRCTLDGVSLRLVPGDILLIQPGQKHEDFFDKGCVFLSTFCWSQTRSAGLVLWFFIQKHHQSSRFCGLLRRVCIITLL